MNFKFMYKNMEKFEFVKKIIFISLISLISKFSKYQILFFYFFYHRNSFCKIKTTSNFSSFSFKKNLHLL